MSIICSSSNCEIFPSIQAFCAKKPLTLCTTHFNNHLTSCNLDHQSFFLLKNVSGQKIQAETILKSIIKGLNQEYKQCVLSFNQILEAVMEKSKQATNAILRTNQYCKELLKIYKANNRFPIIYAAGTIRGNEIGVNDMVKEINAYRLTNFNKILNFDLIANKIIKKLNKIKMTREILYPENYNDNFIYVFLSNSKILAKVDIETLGYGKINTQVSELQGDCPSICSVSPTEVFTTGGYSESVLKCCYLINNETGTVKSLPKIRKRDYAQAMYYQRKVYIFGGYADRTLLNSCDAFSIDSLTWKSLSNLLIPMRCTSVVNFRDNELIFIGSDIDGRRHCLSYNTKTDYYSNFSMIYSSEHDGNVLIRDGTNLFMLHKENIIKANISKMSNWKKKDNSTSFGHSSSRPVIRNRFAYFIDWGNHLFKFDLNKLEIKKVLSII